MLHPLLKEKIRVSIENGLECWCPTDIDDLDDWSNSIETAADDNMGDIMANLDPDLDNEEEVDEYINEVISELYNKVVEEFNEEE